MRGACVALALTLASRPAAAIDAPTIYDNAHMFPIGGRASAMGGAYTALGCDEAALHYNPGALGCAGESRLEIAANVYNLQAFDLPDAFGQGQDIDAITYHSLPSIAGFVRVLDDGDEETGAGRWVVGLSVEVPRSLSIRADPAQPDLPNFVTVSVRDALTTADVGVGVQAHKRLGLGLTIGAAMRNAEQAFSLLLNARNTIPCGLGGECREFGYLVTQSRMFSIGARGKFGVRWAPTDRLSLGLGVESPTIDIYGSSSQMDTIAAAVDLGAGPVFGGVPVRLEGSSDLSLPLRTAIGGAYRFERVTVALDLSLAFPRTVEASYDLEAVEIQGMPVPTAEDIAASEIRYQATWQPNVNLGVELRVADGVALGFGAFTDLSSVSAEDEEDRAADRVHMFGGTAAIGLVEKQARGWFGLSFEYGVTEAQVYSGSLDLDSAFADVQPTATSTLSRWTLAGILGSSYHFPRGP